MLFLESLFGKKAYEKHQEWVESGESHDLLSYPPDENEKFFTSGFFALPRKDINKEILPRLKLKQSTKPFQLQNNLSPLEQILIQFGNDTRPQIFVLCGDEDEGTTISGAGKTTMLRHLYYSCEGAMFVPMSQVYCNRYLRKREVGFSESYILPWLQEHYSVWKQGDLNSRLLILDGLDEIREPHSVQAVCDDLVWLTENYTLRIVISSKLEPKKLTTWDYSLEVGLCTVSDRIWNDAKYCYVLPMDEGQ